MKLHYLGNRVTFYRLLLLVVLFSTKSLLPLSSKHKEPTLLKEGGMTIAILSPDFKEGERIPTKYTCEGQDVSPPLTWSQIPPEAKTLALIVDDPDAPIGVFTHWVIFNLPPDSQGLPEAVATEKQLSSGALQGKNDFGKIGYGGPCPPPGSPHRYQFTLYALDGRLDLAAGVAKKQVLEAIKGHVVAQGQLTGIYQR